jgi:hypothetical protein
MLTPRAETESVWMESVSVNKKAEFDKVMTKPVLDVPLFGIMLKRLRVVYLPKYPLDGTDDTTVAVLHYDVIKKVD